MTHFLGQYIYERAKNLLAAIRLRFVLTSFKETAFQHYSPKANSVHMACH
jgi:hypothetical protein